MVFYRKYRPQTISELDLVSVREKLSAILSSKELPHALLFTGPKGLGKTSSARILAKAINCTEKKIDNRQKTIEPCNKCEACVSITNGSNLDVLEIDAASNGGVDEIRTLRERIKFASSGLRKKVYIIDEVHMLSVGAFNALLKTLEEPPDHVVFVLCTTELGKLPPTVVSRTFQVQFEKPTEAELTASLLRIVKRESLNVDNGVFLEIFRLSEGSFRDAAKILEELSLASLASKGKEITKELLNSVYKTGSISEEVYNLLMTFEKKDIKEGLLVLSRLTESGCDFKLVIERLVEHLRGLLMKRTGIESMEKDVPGLEVVDIKRLLELVSEAFVNLRYSVVAQLPLELVVVEWGIGESITTLQAKVKGQEVSIKEEDGKVKNREQHPEDGKQRAEDRGSKIEKSDLLIKLTEAVNTENKSAAALLKSCNNVEVKDGTIIISTPYPIHAERLSSEKNYSVLENSAENILGKKVKVEIKILPN